MKNVIVKNILVSVLLTVLVACNMEAGLPWGRSHEALGNESYVFPGWVIPSVKASGLLLLVGGGYIWGKSGIATQRRLVSAAEKKVGDLTGRLSLLDRDLDGARLELEDRTKRLRESEGSAASLDESLTRVKGDLDGARHELEDRTKSLSRSEDTVASLQESLNRFERDNVGTLELQNKVVVSENALREALEREALLEVAVSPIDMVERGVQVSGHVEVVSHVANVAGEYYEEILGRKDREIATALVREKELLAHNQGLFRLLQGAAAMATERDGVVVIPTESFRKVMSGSYSYLESRKGLLSGGGGGVVYVPEGVFPNGNANGFMLENGHERDEGEAAQQ